ncbi:hypothetical protein ACIQSP_16450 [Streptomyces nigra]|uniref:hypothetical protein n=1 Tax=Streptomyces nigra TaxID=1827580 RepID=UPI003817E38F
MNDTSEEQRCELCDQPLIRDVVDTTAMASDGGRERQKGALMCDNRKCVMYQRHLNIG